MPLLPSKVLGGSVLPLSKNNILVNNQAQNKCKFFVPIITYVPKFPGQDTACSSHVTQTIRSPVFLTVTGLLIVYLRGHFLDSIKKIFVWEIFVQTMNLGSGNYFLSNLNLGFSLVFLFHFTAEIVACL